MTVNEWAESKRWNPFNSDKLFSQLYRWRDIPKAPPVLVTIDPSNACNLNCKWCNSSYVRARNENMLSEEAILQISVGLERWKYPPAHNFGVEAVCIAGGGESLLNPNTIGLVYFLRRFDIEVGIVTNLTVLPVCHTHELKTEASKLFVTTTVLPIPEILSLCTWIGVSVDAGTPETYKKLKGKDCFQQVVDNMAKLIGISKGKTLGKEGQGHGISYKFLLHPDNIKDIAKASEIAKSIGCRNLHIRPCGETWDKLDQRIIFTPEDLEIFREQLTLARKFEDENFGVFGITHKFGDNLNRDNLFKKCHAIFMTCVFEPPSDPNKGLFNFGLCCDRRGDKNLTLENITDIQQVMDFWGSEKHIEIAEKIDPKKCPRCTYSSHNLIYEKAVEVNNLTFNFM